MSVVSCQLIGFVWHCKRLWLSGLMTKLVSGAWNVMKVSDGLGGADCVAAAETDALWK